jgi:hypothetical protein
VNGNGDRLLQLLETLQEEHVELAERTVKALQEFREWTDRDRKAINARK